MQLDQFLGIFGKKCIFPLENGQKTQKNFLIREKMSLGQADVRLIMQNVGHTAQNVGRTTQNVGRTMRNVGHNSLNVCQGPKGGLDVPPRAQGGPPTPIHEKTLVSRNDF